MNLRVLSALAGFLACATAIAAPADEQPVSAPPGARLVLEAAAQGVQIYTCEKAVDGLHWAFTAPEATLFDAAGRQIGTHVAGPTWRLDDGSRIVGEVVAQAPASAPHAIDWLLLRVKSHEGNGILDSVGLVRRIETQGGTAPTTPCSAASAPARMPYTARYLFYAAPG
jgi:hypothetical protein